MSSFARKAFGLSVRRYTFCCPPRPPAGSCGCPPPVPGGGRKIIPPSDCRPTDIPPNPCVPRFHHGKDTYKKYKYVFMFIGVPLIIFQTFNCYANHCDEPKTECREYEYMRRRDHKYPWGDGVKTFFHNDHVNYLPGECTPPPLDCE